MKKGQPVPEWMKIRLRNTHLGKHHTKETLLKISKSQKGKKKSLEHRKKLSLSKIGDKNHFWRGGVAKLQERIRRGFIYRQWRSDVFTRDNFTCQFCNVRGGYLEADHIKPMALIIKENNINNLEKALSCSELWGINNGRTLCKPCHKLTDSYARNV